MKKIRPFSRKEVKYLEKWKMIRENKVRYFFIHGILLWGLPMGIIHYFTKRHFKMSQFDLYEFSVGLILSCIWGIGMAYFLFYRGQEMRFKQYQNLNNSEKELL